MIEFYNNLNYDTDIVLWHYMKVDYLRDLLDGKLYLHRADLYEDENECRQGFYQSIILQLYSEEVLRRTPLYKWGGNDLVKKINTLKTNFGENTRPFIHFIKCFCIDDYENPYMWNNYGFYNGIAIKTSLRRLVQAIKNPSKYSIKVGKVDYIDKREDFSFTDDMSIVMTKDLKYKEEKELRLAVRNDELLNNISISQDLKLSLNKENNPMGMYIEINPTILIDEIVISSNCIHDGFYISGISEDAETYIQTLLKDCLNRPEILSNKVKSSTIPITRVRVENKTNDNKSPFYKSALEWTQGIDSENIALLVKNLVDYSDKVNKEYYDNVPMYVCYEPVSRQIQYATFTEEDAKKTGYSYFKSTNKEYFDMINARDGIDGRQLYRVNSDNNGFELIE